MRTLTRSELVTELNRMRRENRELRDRLGFLKDHPTLVRGVRGETIVAKMVDGSRNTKNAPHDLTLKSSPLRLEVKYSELNVAIRGRGTKRWVWTKPLGESGRKRFDRLILIGPTDPRFSSYYRDSRAPFVLFDVPFSQVKSLSVPVQRGRYTAIYLTTNPCTVRSTSAHRMWRVFHISASELQRRYSLPDRWRTLNGG